MVSVAAQCKGGAESVTLSQKRYFYDRSLFDRG